MQVTGKQSDQVYKVKDEHLDKVHVRRLRPVNASRYDDWARFLAERERNQGYEYEVSSILELDLSRGNALKGPTAALFLIQWKGYEDYPEYNKWIPFNDFGSKDSVHASYAGASW
jgi:hypothetical protein